VRTEKNRKNKYFENVIARGILQLQRKKNLTQATVINSRQGCQIEKLEIRYFFLLNSENFGKYVL
jgi:hypothetical protein